MMTSIETQYILACIYSIENISEIESPFQIDLTGTTSRWFIVEVNEGISFHLRIVLSNIILILEDDNEHLLKRRLEMNIRISIALHY